jgi:hypothetical protein
LFLLEVGNYTLRTKTGYIIDREALYLVEPNSTVKVELNLLKKWARCSKDRLGSPLPAPIPIINRKKMVFFGDSLVELSAHYAINGLVPRATEYKYAIERF